MGLYRDDGNKNRIYYNVGYIGIMEKKMEATPVGFLWDRVYRDNGKGNYNNGVI